MIVIDTHIWVWWVHGDEHLTAQQNQWLQENEAQGLGVSIISCWEVAKLVEYNRLALPCPVAEWLDQALGYPGMTLLELTPRIIVDSTQLPKGFHKDPADQFIVATSRILDCPLLSADDKILNYPHEILNYPHVNTLK
ncbi:MAG TPA: type II toxin-antitoxin system VapC family toxin [Pyrinomonadaceae bacterium]|nr:type II toxin-antitoxin system VapC family toxin [Pyrinomonadaceae bacterium]